MKTEECSSPTNKLDPAKVLAEGPSSATTAKKHREEEMLADATFTLGIPEKGLTEAELTAFSERLLSDPTGAEMDNVFCERLALIQGETLRFSLIIRQHCSRTLSAARWLSYFSSATLDFDLLKENDKGDAIHALTHDYWELNLLPPEADRFRISVQVRPEIPAVIHHVEIVIVVAPSFLEELLQLSVRVSFPTEDVVDLLENHTLEELEDFPQPYMLSDFLDPSKQVFQSTNALRRAISVPFAQAHLPSFLPFSSSAFAPREIVNSAEVDMPNNETTQLINLLVRHLGPPAMEITDARQMDGEDNTLALSLETGISVKEALAINSFASRTHLFIEVQNITDNLNVWVNDVKVVDGPTNLVGTIPVRIQPGEEHGFALEGDWTQEQRTDETSVDPENFSPSVRATPTPSQRSDNTPSSAARRLAPQYESSESEESLALSKIDQDGCVHVVPLLLSWIVEGMTHPIRMQYSVAAPRQVPVPLNVTFVGAQSFPAGSPFSLSMVVEPVEFGEWELEVFVGTLTDVRRLIAADESPLFDEDDGREKQTEEAGWLRMAPPAVIPTKTKLRLGRVLKGSCVTTHLEFVATRLGTHSLPGILLRDSVSGHQWAVRGGRVLIR